MRFDLTTEPPPPDSPEARHYRCRHGYGEPWRTSMAASNTSREPRPPHRGPTTFATAHRPSTIGDADRIVVVADGEVVESGAHEVLLDREGDYADRWTA